MVLIEEYDEDGIACWGISFEGSNPTADKFLALSSKEEAIRAFELIEGRCKRKKESQGMMQIGTDPNPRIYPAKTLFGKAVDTRLGDLVDHFLETAEDTESEKSFSSDLVLQERARVYRFAASRIASTLEEINGLSYGQGQVG